MHIFLSLCPALPLDISTAKGNCLDGEVRLANGSTLQEGRVELCVNDAWGTICNNLWDSMDASVVCQQLGFSPHGRLPLQ